MIISLSGNWIIKYKDNDITGHVPGDVTGDFYCAGLISDPYFNENYKQSAWITESDWVYEKHFNVDLSRLEDNTYLFFEGIDTYSDIYLNGKLLGSTSNMHLGYKFSVGGLLSDGENVVSVHLKNIYSALGSDEQEKYTSIFNANRIFARKAQCHFGWDWAPKFPGYGIYRDVKLVSEKLTEITELKVSGDMYGTATFNVQFGSRFSGSLEICICKNGAEIARREKSVNCKKLLLTVSVNEPDLWWPNGYGEPSLYEYTVRQKDENGVILCEKGGQFGFRTVKLDQKLIGEDCFDFAIIVNGKRIFCRGSNWIPAECMTGTISSEKYRALVDAARQANMNMLRVWGGGIYESDDFYTYCDQMGIMVWQEFMFACSEIPDDIPDMQSQITEEAVYQVKRLRNHPSIVMWCGMNEVRGSFNEEEEERYGVVTLHYLLRGVVGQLSPETPYIRSSPFAYADTENDAFEGDCHNNLSERCLFGASFKGFEKYNYEGKSEEELLTERIKNFERYVVGTESNFSSECAVLGLCNYESLVKFTPKEKISLDSKFFEERFLGNPYTYVMPTFFERQKVLAKGLFGDLKNMKDLVKKANRSQYEIMKTEIIYSRVNGRSNGFLNWMYNDIWPTGTWSVVDYYLSRKPAFYAIKRCFAPLMTEVCRIGDEYFLCVAKNGEGEAKVECEVTLKTYHGKVEISQKLCGSVSGASPLKLKIELPVLPGRYFEARGYVCDTPFVSVCDLGRYDEDRYNTEYSVNTAEGEKGEYFVTVKASSYLPFFKIWAGENADIEDNYFDLGAGEEKTVRVLSDIQPENFVFNSFDDEWNK